MGVPVVASEQAAGGVDAVPGEHLLVASSAEAFSKAILRPELVQIGLIVNEITKARKGSLPFPKP